MTYKEKEIARLEGMKDGLIKKLVEECEEINDQIIALRKGTPRKKDSQIYFERGYKKGMTDAIDNVISWFQKEFEKQNDPSSKFVPSCVIKENVYDVLEQLKEQKNDS